MRFYNDCSDVCINEFVSPEEVSRIERDAARTPPPSAPSYSHLPPLDEILKANGSYTADHACAEKTLPRISQPTRIKRKHLSNSTMRILKGELDSLLDMWSPNKDRSDYICAFCSRSPNAVWDSVTGRWTQIPTQHDPDCLGKLLEEELREIDLDG